MVLDRKSLREEEILNYLKHKNKECSTSEVAGMLGMNQYTALKLLHNLEKLGEVNKRAEGLRKNIIYWKLR